MAEAKKRQGRPPGSKNKSGGAKSSTAKSSSTAKKSSGGSSSSKAKSETGTKKNGTSTKGKSSTGKTSKELQQEEYLEKLASNRLRDEIWSIVIIAIGIFLAISLQTSAAGKLGSGIHTLLLGCFGWVAYMLPYYMILYGVLMFTKKMAHVTLRSIIFFIVIFLCVSVLNAAQFLDGKTFTLNGEFMKAMYASGQLETSGGAFGMAVGFLLTKVIGIMGLYIFAISVIIISIMMITKTPLSHYLDEMATKRELLREQAERDEEELEMLKAEARANKKEVKTAPIYKEAERDRNANKFEMKSPTYAPIKAGLSPGQVQILDYMNDESLFERKNDLGSAKDLTEKIDSGDLVTHEDSVDSVDDMDSSSSIGLVEQVGLVEPIVLVSHVDEVDSEPSCDPKLVGLTSKPAVAKEPKIPKEESVAISLPTEDETKAAAAIVQYKLPPMDLLKLPVVDKNANKGESLQEKAMKLEKTLKDFNVNAKVVQVTKGPAVTRYEIQPSTGVKVNSIVRLADDIALNLEAKSIRIEAPIPGKAAVGIEVENESVNMVTIREIIDSKNFNDAKSKITFSVGKDISGNSIVADLKSMPHLLIAGSTGSGKSVCINSIIVSMLYKSNPDEVKFVLVDPKVVELGNYNGIPHLLIPVVTDPSKAAAALNWAVAEMGDRYKKFAEEGVRDLESFNTSVKKKKEDDRYLPQIVIIIDELADLMMAAPSQVEESICRLAQMARAAGMHLIVATQRPSVDVITGVIKANIPSRIAFAVSSQFDSRTILDMGGAEKLVGKGDMLFNPLGMAKPIRVQGTFISDKEVNDVIDFVKSQMEGEAEYSNDVIHTIEKVQSNSPSVDEDELLADAIEAVVKSKQASVSGLQRRFRIGYNRAARLVDMMESRGIIGPADGSRPRQVFLTEEEMNGMDEELENKSI